MPLALTKFGEFIAPTKILTSAQSKFVDMSAIGKKKANFVFDINSKAQKIMTLNTIKTKQQFSNEKNMRDTDQRSKLKSNMEKWAIDNKFKLKQK